LRDKNIFKFVQTTWVINKNVHFKRIENGEIFTEGKRDRQFSICKFGVPKISYTSRSQHLAFQSTHLLIFEGKNSVLKYYFVLGINRALLSIFSCFFTLWRKSLNP